MNEFILVEHNAIKKKLHWDLRFEIPNSTNWASFVFNKFPPEKAGERVYVPRAPDHSRENALFTGTIPKGNYGAGTLKKVDQGECIVHKYSPYHIVVEFNGKKLKGIYHFVNTSVFGRRKSKNRVYQFFKGKITK